MTIRQAAVTCAVLTLIGAESGSLEAQNRPETRSADLARQLGALMDQRQLTQVAARHPEGPDRFVAAMDVKNVQLLAISAAYAAPSILREQIWNGHYAEVYAQLNSAGTVPGKLFIQDMDADGVHVAPTGDEPFDIVYDSNERLLLNGDWGAQKLEKAEYFARFERVDEQYAAMLTAMIAQLTGSTAEAAASVVVRMK